MRWSGWPWLQEQLVRHGAEPEEVEEVEEAFRRGQGPEERHRGPGLPAHPALRRIRARIGNRALAQLVREASSRREAPTGESPSAPAATDRHAPGDPGPGGSGRGGKGARESTRSLASAAEPAAAPEKEAAVGPGAERPTPPEKDAVPELAPAPAASPEREAPAEPAPDPARRFELRLHAVLRSLAGGFHAPAWLALLEAWPEARSPLRDTAVRALRTAILRLPAEARKKLARALEELGPVPGVDLLPRLRSALAVAPPGGEAPPPPPSPDDGG